jgi:nicotinate-nucleotide adenylyltransferase
VTHSASAPALKPLGLLGGTFDPVHKAHLALAHTAMAELGLSAIRWIPSGRPGHRAAPGASTEHRLAMLRLALAGESRFYLDPADALSPATTYTINTLARLRGELGPQLPLVFIIGADQLISLDSWCDWRHLFDATHFAVAERPGYPVDRSRMSTQLAAELAAREAVRLDMRAAGSILHFNLPPHPISSSAIRAALAAGQTPVDMLPATVLEYIQSHHLYMDSGI